jgi:hypothetical protein
MEGLAITLGRAALADAIPAAGGPSIGEPTDDAVLSFTLPAQALRLGRQVRFVMGEVQSSERRVDPGLLRLVADAHRWFDDLTSGRATTIAEIAQRDHQQVSKVSRALPLAFLAPDIVTLIVEGRQPPSLTIERLTQRRRPLPVDWAEQRALLLQERL